ncbi:MAG: hypothetical protein DWQ09_07960 [Proteobacteria bacterium]|nr:MAG: hypothetical protein DWQ09_07960 [Pseudomonadota bacterium]
MDSSPAELTARLVDLEIRLSHQEVAIEQITRQALDRDREIHLMAARLHTLEQHLRALSPPDPATSEEETPPPHY